MKFQYVIYLYFTIIHLKWISLTTFDDDIKPQKPNLDMNNCSNSDFSCQNSEKCININQVCDQFPNCADRSDEVLAACYWKYSIPQMCEDSQFKCLGHSKCIPQSDVCNGVGDCLDRSDESSCSLSDRNCFKLCTSSGKCIRLEKICDGIVDCPENEDEHLCTNMCRVYQHKCGINNQCVNKSNVCDGLVDCRNMDDEKNCSYVSNLSKFDQKQIHSCSTNDIECKCPMGYKALNASHCEDINECDTGIDQCSQLCENIPGSFICKCQNNYQVSKSDSRKCTPVTSNQIIFYTTQVGIKYLDLVTQLSRSLMFSDIIYTKRYFFALDYYIYDWSNNIVVFWSDILSGSIIRANFTSLTKSTSNIEIIYSRAGSLITEIAFDEQSNNIYWYDEGEANLNVMNLIKKSVSILRNHNISNPMASLTIHSKQSKLYWISMYSYFWSIVSSALNGQNYNIIVRDRIFPNALSIDEDTDRLYWIELGSSLMSVSASSINKPIKELVHLTFCDPFSSIVVDNHYIFSNLVGKNDVFSVNLLRPTKKRIVITRGAITLKRAKPTGFSNRNDPCKDSKCSQLCLPNHSANIYTCHCAPEYLVDGYECKLRETQPKSKKSDIINKDVVNNKSRKYFWKYMIIIVAIIFATGSILVGLCIYKTWKVRSNSYRTFENRDLYDDVAETQLDSDPLIEVIDENSPALLYDSLTDVKR